MASSNNFNFPYFPSPPHQPPPPPHSPPPPPPHKPIAPTPPSPSNHSTVIVAVFVSLGGVFFLAFLAAALCCFIKKRKKKAAVRETEVIHFDEHRKVREAIVPGPHGPRVVVLSVEDDVHFDEEIKKNEISLEKDLKRKHITEEPQLSSNSAYAITAPNPSSSSASASADGHFRETV